MTSPQALRDAVGVSVGHSLGARVARAQPVSGGSIHDAWRMELEGDGPTIFVKTSRGGLPSTVFQREAEGLGALADAAASIQDLHVPAPLAVSDDPPFLALPFVEATPPDGTFLERFGRAFAALHRAEPPTGPSGERWGFAHDNHLGATPQPNGWLDDWPEFWRRRRLGPLLDAARARGASDPELDRLGDRLLDRLDDILGQPDRASLLHGDLWGGNYLVGRVAGSAPPVAVLIDPAVSVGDREADLAMTRLFGGFGASFEDAYREAMPLRPGSRERAAVYELHHLLNHLVLFGRSYRAGCIERLRRVV